MNKLAFLLLSFLIFQKCDSNEYTAIHNAFQTELDSIVADEMIPGASLGVVLPTNAVLKIVSGFSDKEQNKKLEVNDLMLSGSVGKTYVVPIIMNLIRDEKLLLEDFAKKYFETEDWFLRVPNADSITIKMLLNHTSGIPRYVFKPALWDTVQSTPNKVWTGKERLSFIFDDAPLHTPGKAWKYSDTNYIILGMIIEKITGESYFDILEKQILKPLQLQHTRPARQPKIEGLAAGYTTAGAQFSLPNKMCTNHIYAMNPQLEWTGGGIASSASDLARWGKFLYTGKVLSEEQIRQITTPSEFVAELPDGAKYGFGTFIWQDHFGESYGHSGFMFGYVAIFEYLPEYDVSIAIQINTDRLPRGESLYGYLQQFKAIVKEHVARKN